MEISLTFSNIKYRFTCHSTMSKKNYVHLSCDRFHPISDISRKIDDKILKETLAEFLTEIPEQNSRLTSRKFSKVLKSTEITKLKSKLCVHCEIKIDRYYFGVLYFSESTYFTCFSNTRNAFQATISKMELC